jgi:trans-aconitate methyltransferase
MGAEARSVGRAGEPRHAADAVLWDLHNLAAAERLCDFQFEQVPKDFGSRVLEVGAGIGTITRRLLERYPRSTFVALEPAENLFDDLAAFGSHRAAGVSAAEAGAARAAAAA